MSRQQEVKVEGVDFDVLIEYADDYHKRGFTPIAIRVDSFHWNENQNRYKKKLKFPKDWQQTPYETSLEEFKKPKSTKRSWTPNGIALLCNEKMFVVDVDDVDAWEQSLEKHSVDLPAHCSERSGGGGLHLFFAGDERTKSFRKTVKARFHEDKIDVDLLTDNMSCIVFPSNWQSVDKVDGKWLSWEYEPNDLHISTDNLTALPDELYRAFLPNIEARPSKKPKSTSQPLADEPNKPILEFVFTSLNRHLGLAEDTVWSVHNTDTRGNYKLTHNLLKCIVDANKVHSTQEHSCVFIRKKKVVLNCYSCGKRELTEAAQQQVLMDVWNRLKNDKESDNKGRNDYQQLCDELLNICHEKHYRRERDGSVWTPIEGRTYGYAKYMDAQEFLNDIFLDDKRLSDNEKTIDKVMKYMRDVNSSKFPFIKRDKHHLGFMNGVLNIVTCEFIPRGQVKSGLIVRKFFEFDLDVSNTQTPLFDSIIKYQFPDDDDEYEGVYEFIMMSIGRLFFSVNELDNWQYMLYLMGEGGTGRSTIMNIVTKFFNDVGSISGAWEKTFGLASIYEKEVVVIDDLPKDFEKLFPQTDFQSMVSGGNLQIRGMHRTGFNHTWTVAMLWGGNWYIGYLDKGQVTRRVLVAEFQRLVQTVDPTLEKRILQSELGALMLKCLRLYQTYREKYQDQGVWSFAPAYFHDTQREMKMDRNPLFHFLVEGGKFEKRMDSYVPLKTVKDAFQKWINTPVHKLDNGTFAQVDADWYVVKPNLCKFCKNHHKKGCCERYSRKMRTKGMAIVMNMVATSDVIAEEVSKVMADLDESD